MNIPSKTKDKSSTLVVKGHLGDVIQFSRAGFSIKGTICVIKENVVIVDIGIAQSQLLKIENQFTVVAHRNYEVIL